MTILKPLYINIIYVITINTLTKYYLMQVVNCD